MSELTYKIGAFDKDKRAVSVTFTSGEVVFTRDVNAVLKEDGSYDRTATKARVAEVAPGVAHKIGLGVIKVAEPEAEMPAMEATDSATAE